MDVIRTKLPLNKKKRIHLERAANHHLREIRFAIYSHDIENFHKNLLAFFENQKEKTHKNPIIQICNTPFDPEWFEKLPYQIQFYALHEILKDSLLNLDPIGNQLSYLQNKKLYKNLPREARPSFYYLLISYLLLCGDITLAKKHIKKAKDEIVSFGLTGWCNFILGNNQDAINNFEIDLKQLRDANKDKNAYFTGFEGLIYVLALLKTDDFSCFETIKKFISSIQSIQPHNIFLPSYTLLLAIIDARQNNIHLAHKRLQTFRQHHKDSISTLFIALIFYWLEGKIAQKDIAPLQACFDIAKKNGYQWLAMEYAGLLQHALPQNIFRNYASTKQKEIGIISISSIINYEEPWQRALQALNNATYASLPRSDNPKNSRLAWQISYNEKSRELEIIPKEQRLTNNEKWTKGRTVALKRLYDRRRPAFLSEQDIKICACLNLVKNEKIARYFFDMNKVLPLLVGHPYLFLKTSPTVPVEIIKGEPELRVEERGEKLHIEFFPEISSSQFCIIKETPTRFKVIEPHSEFERIATIIGNKGLTFPASAKSELFDALGNISEFITIHSTINGKLPGIKEIPASSKIHVQLSPYGEGFRLAMFVKPFDIGGPYQKPGNGKINLISEVNGERVQTCRDLDHEKIRAQKIETACPTLSEINSIKHEWILHDPEECLQILLELQALDDEVTVEWPEGEKLTVSPQATLQQLHLNVRKRTNWFEVNGKLQLDESLVFDMQKLLELSRNTTSGFVPLGEGHFLALTEELQKRLDELNNMTDQRQGKLRIHPLAALPLSDLSSTNEHIKGDRYWQAQVNRIKEAQEIHPKIPSTLNAELRDYQIEGYDWLTRLAHWGAGACLADDMGLGKTIQALAIILARAQHGPTLVVAPTSVCFNWQEEANRFAPTLNIVFLGGRSRKKLIQSLKQFDVLIASYGMLQHEEKMLAEKEWQTVVLDEAQAIKNIITKRSKAAMSLNGKFKFITTGTPIENHLSELWTLFNFINPGLLGSLKQFNERFAVPIERDKNKNVKRKLKKIIQPFILRRTKSQVLEELPPRTEIVLQIEMNEEETAFYEALRRNAIEKINQLDGPPSSKNLQILAEIMRLRRACCNTQLVVPESTIPSSKFKIFGKLTDELLENRHKALVFSQFVGHLKIIREFLDEKGLSYQYLDGKTPARKRREEIDKFQSGHGDFFLISLKAGGVGLNLTAADYVIHMDPWWNPAVEDQASNRAHRIGQQHPVTIYRLVTQNTIEEKIVHLHQEKRELANSLLEGTDVTSKISANGLLKLLQED